jgi:hypothetical protein
MAQIESVQGPSDNATINMLWKILVITLASVVIISLLAVIALTMMALDPTMVSAIGTAALTGLLGLFVSK